MEERIAKLEKTNRTNQTLLVIILLLLLAIIALAIGAALFIKSMMGDMIPVINELMNIDFNKVEELLKASDRIANIDWAGLETAINNFKETGEMLGEFNEKMNAISGIFGK